jgi:hypothetical protein
VHARKQQFKKVHMYKMQSERLGDPKSSKILSGLDVKNTKTLLAAQRTGFCVHRQTKKREGKHRSLIFCVAGSSSTEHLEKASV